MKRLILYLNADSFRSRYPLLLYAALALLILTLPVSAVENQDCLTCHGEKGFAGSTGQSLFVDMAQFSKSAHGKADLSCIDCHQDLATIQDYPHQYPLRRAQCSPCHTEIEKTYYFSPHGQAKGKEITCTSCHGQSHALRAGEQATSACLKCHEQVASMLSRSGHGGKTGSCADCHGTHSLKFIESETQLSCMKCHPRQADAYAAGPHGKARAGGNEQAPDCDGCHGRTHSVSRLAQAKNACQNCHPGRAEDVAVSVHGTVFADGQSPSSVCYKCHTGHQVYQQQGKNRATCAGCHAKVETDYAKSLHGYALAKGNSHAPDCTGCHGDHKILPKKNPASLIARGNIHKTCGKCHGEKSVMAEGLIRLPRAAATYLTSVHGMAMVRGEEKAATCLDCHGDHSLKGAADPNSEINSNNIHKTCGKCHQRIASEYRNSIHGRAHEVGITDSPTCTGCHGEHQILSPQDPNSPTSSGNQAEETCARCHNSPTIIAKYGMEGTVVQTYEDSYHGLAVRGRSQRAATCADCHTSHSVQPQADSASTVNAANVVRTCSKCHQDATEKFASSYTHANLGRLESPINAFVRNAYIILLIVIIGGMVLHNLLILNWHVIQAKRRQETGQTVVRFDKMQVVQHLFLTFSFIGLVITGFALKFPDAYWAELLSAVGLNELVRGTLHRICAVILIAVGIVHIGYMIFSRRGREELIGLLPKVRDARDVLDSFLYYTGLGKRKPVFGQFDYSQKGEYWALIWGTALMALTGLILWFPVKFIRYLPGWAIEVSQTIHYYEAWLATLAIIVWHFFFVIFHPEMYPMSWTWLTGKMNVRDLKEHHTGWYDEMVTKGAIEKITSEDSPDHSADHHTDTENHPKKVE
ncbi:MAG: cytochrome b/b6 domain-containing protein [bacterium]|nr:cytochrome b/b6 domain-containing protein [bacterium]